MSGLVNASGAVVETYAYTPHGVLVGGGGSGITNPHRFKGREWDAESGLYYMRARYYDAGLGRFLSEDPIGLAGGLNLYLFVAGDPVNYADPSGLNPECSEWQVTPTEHGWRMTRTCSGAQRLPAWNITASRDWRVGSEGWTDRFGSSLRGRFGPSDPFVSCTDYSGSSACAQAEAAMAARVLRAYSVCEADLRQTGMSIVTSLSGIGALDRLRSFRSVVRRIGGASAAYGSAAVARSLGMTFNEATLMVNAIAVPSVMASGYAADRRAPGTSGPGGAIGDAYRISQVWGPTEILGQGAEAAISCRRAVNGG